MKIITVVGIRKSGKTSTVTALIEAIRRRGKKVGTCKTIFCPTFSIDKSTSNTMRHRRAGSELVCARAKGETAFLYPEALPLSKVLESYKGCDYVLLEGDYYAPVPRIVCAHGEEDALLRMRRPSGPSPAVGKSAFSNSHLPASIIAKGIVAIVGNREAALFYLNFLA